MAEIVMKALILNSGIGSRMGTLASEHPKCMTEIGNDGETILSRQLHQLVDIGVREVVVTTGPFDQVLMNYCRELNLPLKISFVKNEKYRETNYIYSIYCARDELQDDILLMHGDLVFENLVLDAVMESEKSCMAVSTSLPLPEKDFKAVVRDGKIHRIGTDLFSDAVAAQPLYKLSKKDWLVWLEEIASFCEFGNDRCYAENAFNRISGKCEVVPLDIRDMLCNEIDNQEDLKIVRERLEELRKRTVYMCFSTDFLHSGHIAFIKKAGRLGKLIIGVLSDEAVASYKRFPMLPWEERRTMFANIAGVSLAIEQKTLSYKENIEKLRPTYVVHGDDWGTGFQKPIRDEVVEILKTYGGQLIEFPYAKDRKYVELERRVRTEFSMPEMRRGRLKKLLNLKGIVTAIEAHSGLTGLIAEQTVIYEDGGARQFDAMWISSLCDSTAKGKPDIELVDMTARFRTIDEIMDVTSKPIIFDADTGGLTEHFIYTVRTLERMGVSMAIIEDKTGLKKNSLFGTEVEQTQASIEEFCTKITSGKRAQKTNDFMICARIESLILERGMEDALKRAFAFIKAGADAIMIHSRKKEPDEIFEFVEKFRKRDANTPIVVIPTSFNSVTEEEFQARGVNVVIYANQLTRAGFPAMQNAAKMILENHRAKECDDICMSFEDIIRLIPEDI